MDIGHLTTEMEKLNLKHTLKMTSLPTNNISIFPLKSKVKPILGKMGKL